MITLLTVKLLYIYVALLYYFYVLKKKFIKSNRKLNLSLFLYSLLKLL